MDNYYFGYYKPAQASKGYMQLTALALYATQLSDYLNCISLQSAVKVSGW